MKFLVDEMPQADCLLFDKGICKGPDKYNINCPLWRRNTYTGMYQAFNENECIWLKVKKES